MNRASLPSGGTPPPHHYCITQNAPPEEAYLTAIPRTLVRVAKFSSSLTPPCLALRRPPLLESAKGVFVTSGSRVARLKIKVLLSASPSPANSPSQASFLSFSHEIYLSTCATRGITFFNNFEFLLALSPTYFSSIIFSPCLQSTRPSVLFRYSEKNSYLSAIFKNQYLSYFPSRMF